MIIKKILTERYQFYNDFIDDIKPYQDINPEAAIAQELKNGLYFDAISQCVQYIEDLFSFINAGKNPEYFIRNIITYKAGVATNLIKAFNADAITIS